MITALEILTFIILFIIVVTQLLIPGLRGIKLFPLFRRQTALEKEIVELEQQKYDAELEQLVDSLQRRNKKLIKNPKGKV